MSGKVSPVFLWKRALEEMLALVSFVSSDWSSLRWVWAWAVVVPGVEVEAWFRSAGENVIEAWRVEIWMLCLGRVIEVDCWMTVN